MNCEYGNCNVKQGVLEEVSRHKGAKKRIGY